MQPPLPSAHFKKVSSGLSSKLPHTQNLPFSVPATTDIVTPFESPGDAAALTAAVATVEIDAAGKGRFMGSMCDDGGTGTMGKGRFAGSDCESVVSPEAFAFATTLAVAS